MSNTNYIQLVSQPATQAEFKVAYLSTVTAEATTTMHKQRVVELRRHVRFIYPMGNIVLRQAYLFLWHGELHEPKQANNKTK